MSKIFLPIIAVIVITSGMLYYFNSQPAKAPKTLPTYFTYTSQELNELKALVSDKTMDIDELQSLDNKLESLKAKGSIGKTPLYVIAPYLGAAQRDAVFLSYNTHQKFVGSLGPVTVEVVCMFEPEVCQKINVSSDDYSKKLASIVMAKVKARYNDEQQKTKKYEPKEGKEYFKGPVKSPYKGISLTTLTWLIGPVENFRAPQEPIKYGSLEDKQKVQKVADTIKSLTDEQKKIMKEVADLRDTEGLHLILPNRAMKEMKAKNYSLSQIVMIRALMYMAVPDSRLVANDTKYTYLLKRPFERLQDEDSKNPLLKTLPQSSSPSYPSITAMSVAANGAILTYLFPEKKDQWQTLVDNVSYADVWTGDHFTIDIDLSLGQGERVGQAIIKQFEGQGGLASVAIGK